MASSRRTTAGLAPKQVSNALTQNDHDTDLSLARRSQNGRAAKKHAAKLANAKAYRGYKKPVGGPASDEDGSTGEQSQEESEESDEKDDHNEEADDPEAFAPSGGKDSHNHKLRNDSVGTQSSMADADDRQAGLSTDSRTVLTNTPTKRKRLYSNISLLTADDDSMTELDYPRKKADRRLSDHNGRLVYQAVRAELKACMNGDDDAIMASDDDDEDDNVYAVLDEVNDSHDDETSDELETQAMLAAVADSSDEDFPEGSENDDELSPSLKYEFQHGLPDESLHLDLYDGTGQNPDFPATPITCMERKKSDVSERRVRFDDQPKVHMQFSSSSSSTSSSEFEGFPDLLSNFHDPIIPQEQLDASLLQRIEEAHRDAELGNYEDSDSGSSYWDFGESLDNAITWHDKGKSSSDAEGSDDETDDELDGYECKPSPFQTKYSLLTHFPADGDTTDDDIPPPATISKPRTRLHRPSPTMVVQSPKTTSPPSKRRKGPVMGTFTADNTKPYATYDSRTHSILIEFPRSNRNAHANGLSSTSTSPQLSFETGFGLFPDLPSLFPAASADVMMSGIFGGHPGQRLEQNGWVWNQSDLFGGQIGLPESFYPSIALDANGSPLAETEGVYTTEEEDEEDEMDLHAFIDMTHLPSDDEEAPDLDVEETETTDAQEATPTTNGRARSASELLLEHFDRNAGNVSAFKKHHDRFRHASRLPQDISLIAVPLKDGKTAEDLMSPLRKRKSRSKARET